MSTILGLSAFYHDSAAALVRDGEIVAAVQEERFTRRKYDARLPEHSIQFCLQEAGIGVEDLDYVAFYEQPLTKFERLVETYVAYAPAGFASFRRAVPVWLRQKLHVPREIRRALGDRFRGRIVYPSHHESHAASAFFPSPFEEAAILTLDGVGEWATTTVGIGRGRGIELVEEIRFPHSLGLLYTAFTAYCGFQVNAGEYKLMGLAPYGEPKYVDRILESLIDLKDDGSYALDLSYFTYCAGLRMTGERFHRLFGGPPRTPESRIEPRHMDLAASIQKVCEEVVLRSSRHAWERTGRPKNLVLAGGVALNCVANGRVLREGPFENLWIQPAAGDAGGALGAALFTWHQILGNPRQPTGEDAQHASWLGPGYPPDQVAGTLQTLGARCRAFPDESALLDHVAGQLDAGKIVGWFQGRSEFGPRALGARSILGDPRSAEMQTDLNLKIKFREGFRPFAPCVLREHAHEWFEVPPDLDSPYMLLVAPVRGDRRVPLCDDDREALLHDPDLSRRVRIPRSSLPAITHVDYSARLQTVDARHGRFRRLLDAFHARTGCPVLVNTSFNLSWEPIVQTPEQAYHSFMQSAMDVLVIENCVLHKSDQPLGFRPSEIPDLDASPEPEVPPLRVWLEACRADPLARLLGERLPYGGRILEAGCGQGSLTNFLAVSHRTVVGVDDDSPAIETAITHRRIHRLDRAMFIRMTPTAPAWPPSSFDVVLATGALTRVLSERMGPTIVALVTLVRPGGSLIAFAEDPWASRLARSAQAERSRDGGLRTGAVARIAPSRLLALLATCGLENLCVIDGLEAGTVGSLLALGNAGPERTHGRVERFLRLARGGGRYLVVGQRSGEGSKSS